MANSAFDTATIIRTVQASLRARAVLRIGTICELGTVWISDANCLRWNVETARAEVCLGGSSGLWYGIMPNGVEMLARAEGLNWLREDGTVWRFENVG